MIGSFLTMLTYRLPKNMDIIVKPSHCTNCNYRLKWQNLIPIFSYLWQQGKCSECKQSISIRYLLIELISISIFVFTYQFCEEYSIFYAILYSCLFGMIITDLENLLVPDLLQIIFMLCGFYYVYEISFLNISTHLLNCFIIFTFFITLALAFYKIRKIEGIGFADIKFLTITGLFLNWEEIPLLIFLSGFFGIILGLVWKKIKLEKQFPFIPCIIISFVIILNKLINFNNL